MANQSTFKKSPSKKATLCLLARDNQVLLALKKRGFGSGKWNGVGGKLTPGESVKAAASREAFEEIGVKILEPKQVATLNFLFSANPDWNQQVHVFLVRTWTGKPTESEEMLPKWYNLSEILFKAMWPDDKIWLPLVLEGKQVKASFLFDKNQEIINYEINETDGQSRRKG